MENKELIRQLLEREHYDFEDLVSVVRVLRGEGGCPWDREQTHKSIRNDIIEETYEVIEAIDTDDPVLLQVVFHARICEEDGQFDVNQVTDGICRKLIHRHPHVFADVCADTSEEVLKNWENIKSEEKSRKTITDKLRAVPPMLPALMRATKVGKKASCFDFPEISDVMDKLSEEFVEVSEAIEEGNEAHIHEEIGDLLLTVTSLCRKVGVSAEDALRDATDKFINRFERIETGLAEKGIAISDVPVEELDKIWCENKEK